MANKANILLGQIVRTLKGSDSLKEAVMAITALLKAAEMHACIETSQGRTPPLATVGVYGHTNVVRWYVGAENTNYMHILVAEDVYLTVSISTVAIIFTSEKEGESLAINFDRNNAFRSLEKYGDGTVSICGWYTFIDHGSEYNPMIKTFFDLGNVT